jgi:hypothetical protein
VFVDRGAVDRADFRRPNAVLNNPFDAPDIDAAQSPTDPNTTGDTDPQQSFVRLVNPNQFVEYFEIQLIDEAGTGLDASTINGDTVLMTENGRQLLPNRDFTFGYSENSRTIRLTPLAGVWNQDSVYEITLNNRARRVVELPSGGGIADGDQVVVTDATGRETVFEFDSGYTLGVPQTETLTVTDVRTGFRDTDTFTITSRDGLTSVTFEINTVGAVASSNVAIPLASTGTVTEIRDAILRVLNPTLFSDSPLGAVNYATLLGIAPVAVGNDAIQLGTLPAVQSTTTPGANLLPGHVVNMSNISSGLLKSGTSDAIVDGRQFVYTRGDMTVTFEFDSNDSFDPAAQTQTLRRVGFNRTDTPDQIALSIASALRGSSIDLTEAIAIGDGLISVGGQVGDVIDLGNSRLSLTGNPGVTPGLSITVPTAQTGQSIDGTTVTISVGVSTETFLFTTDPQLTSANTTIVVAATANSVDIATALQAAIELAFENDFGTIAQNGSVITLDEVAAGQNSQFTTVSLVSGPLVVGQALIVGGVSGGAIAVSYTPSDSFPAVSVATKLQQAVDDANIDVDVFSPGGGVLLFAGANSVVTRDGVGDPGVVAETIVAVSDLAGNPVNPTRTNNETRFTIIMPDVRFDFGDAPLSYGTLLQSPTPDLLPTDLNYVPGNGARHAVIGGSTASRLGRYVDTEADGQSVDLGIGVSDDSLLSVGTSATAADLITPTFARISVTAVPRIGDLLTITVNVPDPTNPGTPLSSTTFEFQYLPTGATAVAPRVAIPVAPNARASDVAASLLAVIVAQISGPTAGITANINPANPEQIELRSASVGGARPREFNLNTQSSLFSSAFSVDDSDPTSLAIVFNAVPTPGQLIVIRTADQTRTYEFVDQSSNPRSGSVPVLIQDTFDTAQVASALLAAIQPSLNAFGGSILASFDEANASTIELTTIDDEDGVSVVTFNQGGSVPPAYFFGRYNADNLNPVLNQSMADQVFGFINPADPAGANFEIWVTGGGLIDAWIDYNGNGVFDEDGSEVVLENEPVVNGLNTKSITNIPANASDKDTWMRIRLSDAGNTSPTGVAIGGEVEDYLVSIRRVEVPLPSGAGDQFIAMEDTPLRIDSSLSAANPPLEINRKTLLTNDNVGTQLLPVRYFVDLPRVMVEPDQTSFPNDDVLVYRTPAGGTLEINRTAVNALTPGDDRTGSFLYTPPKDFYGIDTFRYRLSTQQNANSDSLDGVPFETVTINVLPDNDAPGYLRPTDYVLGTSTDITFVTAEPVVINGVSVGVLTIDAAQLVAGARPDATPNQTTAPLDESNQAILVRSVSTSSGTIIAGGPNSSITTSRGGTLTAVFNSTAQWIESLQYTPAADFNSNTGALDELLLDEFTFTMIDSGISILPPELEANLNQLATNGQLGGNSLVSGPYFISGGERNQFLRQGVAVESMAKASIRVVPRNDSPVPVTDYVGLTDATGAPNDQYLNFFSNPATRPRPTEDNVLVFPASYLLANDASGPGGAIDETDPLIGNDGAIQIVSVAMDNTSPETLSRGMISLDPATGMITFTPAANVYGEITFTYTIIDSGIDEGTDITDPLDPNDGGTRTVNGRTSTITSTIFVAPVNDAPVAYDRIRRTSEDTSITIDAAELLSAGTATSSQIVVTATSVTLPDATGLVNGETLIFTATNGQRVTIEFNTTGIASEGTARVVRYAPTDLAPVLATRLEQALRAVGFGGTATGSQVIFNDAGIITEIPRTNQLVVNAARQAITIPSGADLADGERIVISDALGVQHTFEFTTTGNVASGVIPVAINAADSSQQIAEALSLAMLVEGFGATPAATTQTQFRVRVNNATAISAQTSTSAIRVIGSDVIMPIGAMLQNGERLEISNITGGTTIVEFGRGTAASNPAYVFIPYLPGDTAPDLSTRLAAALNNPADPNAAAVSANMLTFVTWEVIINDVAAVAINNVTSSIAYNGNDLILPALAQLIDGETITITDDDANVFVIELNVTGTAAAGSTIAVAYSPVGSLNTLRANLATALQGLGIGAQLLPDGAIRLGNAGTIALARAASSIQILGTNILVPAGINLIDGQRIRIQNAAANATIIEFNTSGTPGIGADIAVGFGTTSTAADIAIALQEQLRAIGFGATADVGALGVPAGLARVSLQVINNSRAGELPAAPGDFDSRLAAPFNESEQTAGLRIIEVAVAGRTLNLQTNPSLVSATPPDQMTNPLVACGVNEACLASDAGGRFRFEIESEVVNGTTVRFFSKIHYTPPRDYNEQLPFAARDLLTYRVIDNGRTTITSPAGVQNLPPLISVRPGTLTMTVGSVNDAPTFDSLLTINVLERDDNSSSTIPQFVSRIFAGPAGALDENQNQQVNFLAPRLVSGNPAVMSSAPVINYTPGSVEGSLTVFPAPDQVGQLVYEIIAFEVADPTVRSIPTLITINVRPVNDPPRINPAVAGTTQCVVDNVSDDPMDANYLTPAQLAALTCTTAIAGRYSDEGYSVSAGLDTDADSFRDQATIRYTLREDNTRPIDGQNGQVQTGSYFIPVDKNRALPADIAASVKIGAYTRLGLLDIYDIGPANEAIDGTAAVPTGGAQRLELFNFPDRTALGGTLVPRFSTTQFDINGNPLLIGLLYTPPTDFNNNSGAIDSFEYTVRDDNPGDGETYSLSTNSLVQDRRFATSLVQLSMNPVNDRPEFSTLDLTYEVAEDGPLQVINGFAFGISAGPTRTAFDEIGSRNGQKLNFTETSLSFDDADFEQFFDVFPTVDLQGQLRFKPAKDVFGTFEFAIVLNDDGGDNSTRGDLQSSIPATLTINVRPVNDRPVIKPEFNTPETNPLRFQLSEGGTIDVLLNGDGSSVGLLDVFNVGPANEAENIVPGGNQNLALTQPIPITTAQGGRLTLITPPAGQGSPFFRYTPRDNYVGLDNFIYTVTDDGVTVPLGAGGLTRNEPQIASGTVTFEVLPVNDAPQFSGAGDVESDEDANTGNGRGVVSIANWATNVQAGPPGADDENGTVTTAGQPLRFEIRFVSGNSSLFTVAPNAVVNGSGSASLNYTLAPNANGSATYTVQLFDEGPSNLGNGDVFQSDIRTFTIDVNPINDAPSFVSGGTVGVQEDRGPYAAVWATSITPGPADESNQTVSFRVAPVSTLDAALFTTGGQPSISNTGILSFTPAANANGTARLRVVAVDSEGAESAAVNLDIAIAAVNDFPTPVGDLLMPTNEDVVLTIPASQLLANDVDVDLNDTIPDELRLSMPLVQRSVRGAIVRFNPVTGIVTYDPTASRELQSLRPDSPVLADSFSYAITDRAGRSVDPPRQSNSVLVTVNVSGVNDAPILNPDTPTLNATGSTTINVLANDEDIDGTIRPETLVITSQPAFGDVIVNSDGTIQYTPFTGFPGLDEFRYRVFDDLGAISEEGRVTISPNVAPVVRDDNGFVFSGETVNINILGNDVDSDGFNLSSVQIESGPFAGNVTPLPDGTVRYTPAVGFTGRDSFRYSVADSRGRRSGLATVNIQVVSSRLQNPNLQYDVNDDGEVSALDALLIINHMNRFENANSIGSTIPTPANLTVELNDPIPPDTYLFDGVRYGAGYFDVSGNRVITELDALQVINELNRRDTSGSVSEPLPATATSPSNSTGVRVASGEPLAPMATTSEKRDVTQPLVDTFDVFEIDDKWVDTTNGAAIELDVLDHLVAAQRSDVDPSSEESGVASRAIDVAMSRLL